MAESSVISKKSIAKRGKIVSESESDEESQPLAKKVKHSSPPPPIASVNGSGRNNSASNSGAGNGNSANGNSTLHPAKTESPISDDDDAPLSAMSSPFKNRVKNESQRCPSPETPTKIARKSSKSKKPKSEAESEADSEEESEGGSSDAKQARSQRKSAKKSASVKPKKTESKKSKSTKDKKSAVKPEPKSSAPKSSKSSKTEESTKPEDLDEEEGDEEDAEVKYEWWKQEQANQDNTVKWSTLEHNGVLFPPEYKPLPSNVKLKYNGKPVSLSIEAEEVAGFYGAMLETEHAKDQVFNENFFKDFKEVCKKHPSSDGVQIKEFAKCDFRDMYDHFAAERETKKSTSSEVKKALKAEKDEMEKPFLTCTLDGRKEVVGNFRIEPPGLFRGRGQHPRKGMLKQRVVPEQVTINIGKDATVPVPPAGHKWLKVQHDNTVTWLAYWKENINSNHKYVMLAPGSSLKGQSDFEKYEKARELKNNIDRIRRDYNSQLSAKLMADRQRATAMYFIDRLALRAGNEKSSDEADTVGCCSLRFEHVTLKMPNILVFDFLGKDSVRYHNEVEVENEVFKNIRIFKKEPKKVGDDLFDRLTTSILNKHLLDYQKGLTAKVFRTYNASVTMEDQLIKMTPENATVAEKVLAFNRANAAVAILCNHKKGVAANFDAQMEKALDKVRALKYQRRKLRHALFTIDQTLKKNKIYKPFVADESDMDEDWMCGHEEQLLAAEIKKIEKKFAAENEKALATDPEDKLMSDLDERIKDAKIAHKEMVRQRKAKEVAAKSSQTPEKIVAAIKVLDERIDKVKNENVSKSEGAEIALGTSKTNYIAPQIVFAWGKKHGVPPERLLPKTLITKFAWAVDTDADWKF